MSSSRIKDNFTICSDVNLSEDIYNELREKSVMKHISELTNNVDNIDKVSWATKEWIIKVLMLDKYIVNWRARISNDGDLVYIITWISESIENTLIS